MARRATLENVAEEVKDAAAAASTRTQRKARAAMAEGAKAARAGQESYRTVFHDLADAAERQRAEGSEQARRFGAMVTREVSARPGMAILALAATAAVAASFAGWALARRR